MADRESNWQDHLAHIAMTDVGMRRANNQDSKAVVLAIQCLGSNDVSRLQDLHQELAR